MILKNSPTTQAIKADPNVKSSDLWLAWIKPFLFSQLKGETELLLRRLHYGEFDLQVKCEDRNLSILGKNTIFEHLSVLNATSMGCFRAYSMEMNKPLFPQVAPLLGCQSLPGIFHFEKSLAYLPKHADTDPHRHKNHQTDRPASFKHMESDFYDQVFGNESFRINLCSRWNEFFTFQVFIFSHFSILYDFCTSSFLFSLYIHFRADK